MLTLFRKFTDKQNLLPAPVKAAFWFTVCSFLQKGITVLTTPIWTRIFSAEDFGLYSIFISWKAIIGVFVTFNLTGGVFTKGLLKYEDKQEDFISSLVGLLSVITLVFVAIYFTFKDFWNGIFELNTTLMICMFVQMWTETVFALWAARQKFDYKYKKLVAITLSVAVVNPIIGIIAALMFPEQKVDARVISVTILNIIVYTGFFVYQFLKSRKLFGKTFWKYAILFNLPLVPHYLAQTVLNSSDRIMIGKMVGEREAGLYSLAYSAAMLLTILNASIQSAFNPWLYKKIKAADYKSIPNASYIVLVVVAAVNFVFIFFAPEVIRIFAPKEYLEAVWTMPPVTMSVFFMFMYCLFADFEFYYEKTMFIMIASVLGATLNIGLNYLCIPAFGYISAGYTTLICYMIFVGAHYLAMRHICHREIGNQRIYNPYIIMLISVVFMISGFAVMTLYERPILKYSILTVILLIIAIFYKKIKNLLMQFIDIKDGKIHIK